ncbi:unnamed protein product [Linum tenue]|uniref:Uncharacterized protein n=1 Tax=Linum tenue TaxID=586396 RepID=A0AAV0KQ69_9ROSI|nr:unnamed protein product [Linum tenue]
MRGVRQSVPRQERGDGAERGHQGRQQAQGPAIGHLRRLLPRQGSLPPRPQAGEPPPRRELGPQGLRLRPQRRPESNRLRRPAPHLVRDPCLRRPRDSRKEGLRRRQGRHLVVRCHLVRPRRRLPPFQRHQPHGHVQEDLQGTVPLPQMDLAGPPPLPLPPPRRQSRDENHRRRNPARPLVQKRLQGGELLPGGGGF